MEKKLIVSSSPHMRSKDTISSIMLNVVIALMPALIAAVYFFGLRALSVVGISVISCVLSEYIWQKACGKPITINDWSAVVTGVLLGFNLPVTVPLWIPVIGGVFAIIIVKQFFGGLGQNFMNPALAARAFLLASWPVNMTTWVNPFTKLPLFMNVDVISSATPLGIIKSTEVAMEVPGYYNLFMGNIGGCIGETSVLALLIGACYLLVKGIISWRIPTAFILTVAVLTYIISPGGMFTGDAIYHILSGGLILGAFYMATDYSSSPMTPNGKLIMGMGCGLITSLIRIYGGYPEGVSYSILLMNILVPIIDKYTLPMRFGGVKVNA